MIESNDQHARADQHDRVTRETAVRGRRRKSAKWKSGLMLTGLGAVVLGAGYLAGVNAPAVGASASAGVAASSGTIAQAGAARSDANQNQFLVPPNTENSDDRQNFVFNGDDEEGFFGNQALPGDSGAFQSNGGSGSGPSGQLNQQFGQRFGGRRNRQFGGSVQQQPNFGGPITRSRGS
ncbi:MAG: hypothetical protein ACM30E_10575 [Nitrososphaerales archaeon]